MAVSAGQALVFNGVTNHFYATQLPFKEDCLSHDFWPEPIALPLSTDTTTANDLFMAAQSHFENAKMEGNGELSLELERDLVVAFECHACHAPV